MEKLTPNSTVGDALKNPKAVALVEAMAPGMTSHPALKLFRKTPLKNLVHMERLHLTPEKLNALLEQVNAE